MACVHATGGNITGGAATSFTWSRPFGPLVIVNNSAADLFVNISGGTAAATGSVVDDIVPANTVRSYSPYIRPEAVSIYAAADKTYQTDFFVWQWAGN